MSLGYILVVGVIYSHNSVQSTIPIPYDNIDQCKTAGDQYKADVSSLISGVYYSCLPVPVRKTEDKPDIRDNTKELINKGLEFGKLLTDIFVR